MGPRPHAPCRHRTPTLCAPTARLPPFARPRHTPGQPRKEFRPPGPAARPPRLPATMPLPPAATPPDAPQAMDAVDAPTASATRAALPPRAPGVPVYVMLPLDTLDSSGTFRYASTPWFNRALSVLADAGVHGVAVDVWWAAVEPSPRAYVWTGVRALLDACAAAGLRVQTVLSFHACGGNVGDDAAVPLPAWVAAAADRDPDLFYSDAPRGAALGARNPETLSLFADAAASPDLGARTPLQCYADLAAAFRREFEGELGSVIDEVVFGAGPCGELRYPAYYEPHGWRFPGVGEFQCHDRRALASLAAAAAAAGRPEWGYGGPHDAPRYNDAPADAGFTSPYGGSWDTEYGRFFVTWYSGELVAHAERLAAVAAGVFGVSDGRATDPGSPGPQQAPPQAALATPPPTPPDARPLRREARSASLLSLASDDAAPAPPADPSPATGTLPRRPAGLDVTVKIPGVHWWYRSPMHAAEMTAGYDNVHGSGATYAAVARVAADAGLGLTLTCVEMCDGQHPPEVLAGPEGLLRQVREIAAAAGVSLGGENALPIFGPFHTDGMALSRVAYNTDAWGPPLAEAARARAELYGDGDAAAPPAADAPGRLPPMRAFTFLRLTPAMVDAPVVDEVRAFVKRMRREG